MRTNTHTTHRARHSALLWAQLRHAAPNTYNVVTSLTEARAELIRERRYLLARPASDAAATLRWRRLGLLLQALDAHVRPVERRAILG